MKILKVAIISRLYVLVIFRTHPVTWCDWCDWCDKFINSLKPNLKCGSKIMQKQTATFHILKQKTNTNSSCIVTCFASDSQD